MSLNEDFLPDAEPASQRAVSAPLFPLPSVFLFPGTVIPLHVFEPRYRQMIEDSLDGPGRIVIGTVLEDWHDKLEGAPPVHPIAGLGEIARHERLPDGRFVILLAGLARTRIQELESDRLYRRVSAVPLAEIEVPDALQDGLRSRLREAVLARSPDLVDLPEDMPLGHLTDLLLLRLQLPQSKMQDLYSELSIADRAEAAIREHAKRLPPPRRSPGIDSEE